MANRSNDAAQHRNSDDRAADHKGLIYAITGGILVVGLLLMTFYGRERDPMPIASVQKPLVTAQR